MGIENKGSRRPSGEAVRGFVEGSIERVSGRRFGPPRLDEGEHCITADRSGARFQVSTFKSVGERGVRAVLGQWTRGIGTDWYQVQSPRGTRTIVSRVPGK